MSSRPSSGSSRRMKRTASVNTSGGGAEAGGAIQVFCRIRPPNRMEQREGGKNCVEKIEDDALSVWTEKSNPVAYAFDGVFDRDSTQAIVFERVAQPIVQDVLSGFNATIIAYGQTAAGKTHTMEGKPDSEETRGLIPRAVKALFDGVASADPSIEFLIKVSFVELYMEKICDLLDKYASKSNLTIREDKIRGVYIAGVTEECVTNTAELLAVMADGSSMRAVAATGMNEGSSRSHSCFTCYVLQRNIRTNSVKTSKLTLVDLAGSEMVSKTGATGQQLNEAKTINKSLSALGNVINALTSGSDASAAHIPYRDSKLTRLLQDSLGGNAKTALIICCSPSSYNAAETLSTLRFGKRAKNIKNVPTINETKSVEELQTLLNKHEATISIKDKLIITLQQQLADTDALYTPRPPEETGAGAAAAAAAPGAEAAGEGGGGGTPYARELESANKQLTEDLNDERDENARLTAEAESLRALLREKEGLLLEAGTLLKEASAVSEQRGDEADELAHRVKAAEEETAEMGTRYREAEEKYQFEQDEQAVERDRLRAENRRLLSEGPGGEAAAAAALPDAAAAPAPPPPPANGGDRDTGGGGMAVVSIVAELRERGVALDAPTSAWLGRLEGRLSAEKEALVETRTEARAALAAAAEASNARVAALEASKRDLEAELAGHLKVAAELEAQLDENSAGDGNGAGGGDAAREKQQRRQLQQRLEQLVHIHRQLLKKYASLDLESGEARKKIALRDDRIRQLEQNGRVLATNMRSQAERHVSELVRLREQVAGLREEQQQQLEARLEASAASARRNGGYMRTMRGGGGGGGGDAEGDDGVRTIRGGGRVGASVRDLGAWVGRGFQSPRSPGGEEDDVDEAGGGSRSRSPPRQPQGRSPPRRAELG